MNKKLFVLLAAGVRGPVGLARRKKPSGPLTLPWLLTLLLPRLTPLLLPRLPTLPLPGC
ncbi:MAG: hypothetical protein U1F19_00190 [Lysobacterales bacterium]